MIVALDARTAYAATRRGIGKSMVDLLRRTAAMRPAWRFIMPICENVVGSLFPRLHTLDAHCLNR